MMAFVVVEGRVGRVFHDGKGVEVVETLTARDGSSYERKFTAWFDEPFAYGEGVPGKFSGVLSARVREWVDRDGNPVLSKATGKQGVSAELAINDARFELSSAGRGASQPVSVAELADELPF
jgi:hypothetical protein